MNSTTPLLLAFALSCSPVQTTVLDSPAYSETQTVMAPPSATPRSAELQIRLETASADLPENYIPRTHHLDEQGDALWSNRLLLEQSPYLIQHAHNPVDWHPWGDEAFALAKELGRPVLLSVGYATCHWCHVMEKESFEDLEIAAYINENYIAIKVDREERPDVDEIYMTAVHLLNGRGGWPMTVWLTPDRDPFYAGTYFPARDGDRGSSRPGFFTLLQELRRLYVDKPLDVVTQAQDLTAELRRVMAPAGKGSRLPGGRELNAALSSATQSFDSTWGGRQGRPKFPSSFPLRLLMRAYWHSGDPALLEMVERTLDQMAAGGIYDQIGGGFHRYSTDSKWLVPHFEKMLYDNALLAVIYLEAYQLSGHTRHADIARDILAYVQREMTRPEGGFWSATDADSMGEDGHREEGLFFVWTPSEVLEVLGPTRMAIAIEVYGITDRGNFEGANIPTRRKTLEASAKKLDMDVSELKTALEGIRLDLRAARSLRPPPLLDDKMLTAWNGLMISAFATGSRVLGDPSLGQVAIDAAEAILRDNQLEDQLSRSSREGVARHSGLLEDHAFLCASFLDLFETTSDPRWLREAIALDQELGARFEDPNGGFFRTPTDHETLLVREKPNSDGAVPSGNSVHALNLLRLAELTTDPSYTRRAESTLRSLGTVLRSRPSSLDELLLAADWSEDLPRELILILPEGTDPQAPHPFSEIWTQRFLPNAVRVAVPAGERQAAMALQVPLVQNKVLIDEKPTIYLCEQGSCQQPTTDLEVLARQLDALETSE